MTHSPSPFVGLVNLASESLGARALATNDDFFAEMQNLVKDEPAIFIADKYTDRGKWMDGWESRRKRGEGHDWCVLKLGAPGTVRAVDVDTSHFLGNQPPFASLEGAHVPEASADAWQEAAWTPLVHQQPIRPGSSNLFVAAPSKPVTHIRLNLFPDGGVARLRVYGDVEPTWNESTDAPVEPGEVDLVALAHGGLALACSDAFFGPMNNLISPGRAENMGGGWETRRRHGRPYDTRPDWILLKLAARGTVRLVEVDTNHFKGNYPDRCAVDVIDAQESEATPSITTLLESSAWHEILPEQPLSAHQRHFFRDELAGSQRATHVRLRIFPDGGISRLRLYGRRA